MVAITEELIQEMARAVVREVDPEAVYLFGSCARGQAGPDSDVDLLILEREPFGLARSRLDEIMRVRRALSTFRVAKDILVFSGEEFRSWKDSLNHIIARCLREGRLLYERP